MQKIRTDMNDMSDTGMEWIKTGYGFRWEYLLSPFIPTLLFLKKAPTVLWNFVHNSDDDDLLCVYTEDSSNRVAFLVMLLFLVGCLAYMLCT